jgi:hypothetical protein
MTWSFVYSRQWLVTVSVLISGKLVHHNTHRHPPTLSPGKDLYMQHGGEQKEDAEST